MKRRLLAYQQGHFDGLCGVYAVVNAVRASLANRQSAGVKAGRKGIPRRDCEELFTALLHTMASRSGVDTVMRGLSPRDLLRLLRAADTWLRTRGVAALAVSRPFSASVHRKWVVARASRHLASPATAVIVGGREPWAHWTVITKITSARLHLLDSDGSRLMSIERHRGGRYHAGLIDADCLFLVTLGQPSRRTRWRRQQSC